MKKSFKVVFSLLFLTGLLFSIAVGFAAQETAYTVPDDDSSTSFIMSILVDILGRGGINFLITFILVFSVSWAAWGAVVKMNSKLEGANTAGTVVCVTLGISSGAWAYFNNIELFDKLLGPHGIIFSLIVLLAVGTKITIMLLGEHAPLYKKLFFIGLAILLFFAFVDSIGAYEAMETDRTKLTQTTVNQPDTIGARTQGFLYKLTGIAYFLGVIFTLIGGGMWLYNLFKGLGGKKIGGIFKRKSKDNPIITDKQEEEIKEHLEEQGDEDTEAAVEEIGNKLIEDTDATIQPQQNAIKNTENNTEQVEQSSEAEEKQIKEAQEESKKGNFEEAYKKLLNNNQEQIRAQAIEKIYESAKYLKAFSIRDFKSEQYGVTALYREYSEESRRIILEIAKKELEKLNKKFGTNYTYEQLKSKYKSINALTNCAGKHLGRFFKKLRNDKRKIVKEIIEVNTLTEKSAILVQEYSQTKKYLIEQLKPIVEQNVHSSTFDRGDLKEGLKKLTKMNGELIKINRECRKKLQFANKKHIESEREARHFVNKVLKKEIRKCFSAISEVIALEVKASKNK